MVRLARDPASCRQSMPNERFERGLLFRRKLHAQIRAGAAPGAVSGYAGFEPPFVWAIRRVCTSRGLLSLRPAARHNMITRFPSPLMKLSTDQEQWG